MNTSVHYEYADGSANLYLIKENELRYVPITPKESSSGTYSGGEPKTVTISASQFDELKKLLEAALANSANHITNRVMMSGMISMIGDKTKDQCILKPNCKEMLAIESKLKELLK